MQRQTNPGTATPLRPGARDARPARTLSGAQTRRARSARVARRERMLASYTDWQGHPRELLAWRGVGGSMLVVDRDGSSGADRRLVAHLAADEPPENAAIVCEEYLRRVRTTGCACRLVTLSDLCTQPHVETVTAHHHAAREQQPLRAVLKDRAGRRYRLMTSRSAGSIPQLRWARAEEAAAVAAGGEETPRTDDGAPVSLREAIASLESYEPLRTLTEAAVAIAARDGAVSTTVLRAELARVQRSPIVLNRGLREAVLAAVACGELSMSEIAIRCGRVKRDCKGNESGETSWLARRLGLLPEGGQRTPTPWVHSEVLGLIARRGIGVAPREVEL